MNKDAVAEMSQQYQVEAAQKLVPEGYKQTEVGVIPEDWEVLSLGELGTFKNGINKGANDFGYGLPFVNLMDVFGKPAISNTDHLGLINSTELDRKEYSLEFGDVLFIRSSVKPSGVGLTSVVLKDLVNTVYSGFLIRFRSSGSLSVKFKKFCFYEEDFRKRIISSSTVSANTNINQDALKAIFLAFPRSIKEQDAIANALSDVDALLSELEKLIAKKQAIKTATMQQLLTGRTRLPQFAHHPDGSKKGYKQSELGEIPEDWGICNLSDFVLTLESGVSVNSIEQSDAFSHGKHVLKTSCVEKGYFYGNEKKSILPNDLKRAKCTPKAGCIIVSRMNTPSLVGEIGYVEKDCSSSFLPDRLWQIIFKKDVEVNTRWLAYFLSFPDISGKIKEAATGTSGSMKNISKGSFLSLALSTPNLEEQTAIATILSDMDAEIQALEHRLNKTRQIKQGMMQELLTGKTRLVASQSR